MFLASTLFVVDCVEWESCRRSTSEVLFGLEREVVVTVVTQCDVGRLWNLDRICERWRGPVSVAVYAEAGGGEEARRAAYRNTARCSRAFVTVAEALSGEQYPVNRLRNLAWDACRSATTHAWFLDADFWPSRDAWETIAAAIRESESESEGPRALVVAAFEFKWEQFSAIDTGKRSHGMRASQQIPATLEDLTKCLARASVSSAVGRASASRKPRGRARTRDSGLRRLALTRRMPSLQGGAASTPGGRPPPERSRV